MKIAVIIIGLFFAFVAGEDKKDCPLMEELKKTIDECVESLDPSEETLKLVAEEKGEDNVEVQCFQACMMNKAGLMKSAKFQFDRLEELLRSAEEPNEEEINKIVAMMKSCKDESEISEDECKVAGNYAKCAKAKKQAEK